MIQTDNFTHSAYTSGWELTITKNEDYGRKVVENTITTFLKDDVKIEGEISTTIKAPVDLIYNVKKGNKNYNIGIEVKNWSKPCTYLRNPSDKIPDSVMLKSDKLDRMLEYRKSNNLDFILYVAILDNKAYYFNIDGLNYNDLPKTSVRQKVQQMNPNSRWKEYSTYFIPLSKAYKIIDVKEGE